jgi:transposase
MLPNVQQKTTQPVIQATVSPGTLIYTDEYDIYARLPEWGYGHQTVCHSRGEYARDEDGDGFHEVHVNAMEGFWSLLRSGYGLIGAFPRRSFRYTWAFSNSSIIVNQR